MRDLPSCFGENAVQVADASCSNVGTNKSPNNSVTCIYTCKLFDKISLVSLVWSKNLMGQTLSIEIVDDPSCNNHICKVDVKPSLFSRRKGSKCLDLHSGKIEVFWDLTAAKFANGPGPEPLEGYYVGVVCKGVMALLIGDLTKEAFKRSGAIASSSSGTLISKREHIFGKRVFSTKARFCDNGTIHNLKIEHDSNGIDDQGLVIHVDTKMVVRVRHLRWKFRGNDTFFVDGLPVEVSWDVHDWLFGPSLGSGSAVFMFRASLSNERTWASSSLSLSPCPSTGPCGSPPSFSWSFDESKALGHGVSLFLYAWKNE